MPFSVGENVGPYRIIEQLGQGGMATVFKAYHASLDRYVAIKVLHPAFGEDPNFEARFGREARVVAKLEHINIVPIYDFAEHEKRPYLVMKFIEGSTLKATLDKGPLSSKEILRIVESVGSALAYAHKREVLHRDIKPSNVLVAADGQIYLADFGLARIAQLGESTLSGDMIIGTPQYISPEQAMGLKDLDERTDLYSFGVMIYEMVVGKVPFNADTPFSVIHDHIYSPLPLPRVVNPQVPDQVERVLLKALAKERSDRYETVDQMVAAFKEAWSQADAQTRENSATRTAAGQTVPSMKPVSMSVESPRVDTSPAMIPTEPKTAQSDVKAVGKRKFPWVGIFVALIMLCCVSYGAHAIRNRLFGPLFANARNNNSQATPIPDADGKLPRDVASALESANSNPGDPDLQFDLAIAYWEANKPDAAYETFHNVINLVGPRNAGYYIEAGDELLDMQAWTPAALMYFQAVKSFPANKEAPPDLLILFHETVYKSAERSEANRVLPFDEIAKVDEPISLVARARYEFYTKNTEQAYAFLEQARKLNPDMHEAILLEAEISAMEGKPERAGLLVGLLATDDSVPEWIQTFAEYIITERLK